MEDRNKTKRQLIEELANAHVRITELEGKEITFKREREMTKDIEERFKSTLESMDDLVFVLDKNGIFCDYYQPFGGPDLYAPADVFIGKSYKEIMPTNVVKLLDEAINSLMKSGEVQQIDYDLDIQGSKKWFTAKISARKNIDGAFTGITGVVRDFTDRKEADQALLESEQKFRAIFENANDGMILADPHSRYFSNANKQMTQMLGYDSEEEIRQLRVEDIHPRSELPFILEEFGRHARRDLSRSDNIPVKRRDGSVFYASISSSPITIAGKDSLFCIFRDNTAHKEAEEALKRSEERFRTLIESSVDVVTVIDAAGKVVYQSPNFKNIWGRKAEGEIGKNMFKDVHPNDISLVEEAFERLIHDPQASIMLQVRARHENGTWRTLEVIARNNLEYPSVRGIVVNFRDITERKQIQEDLYVSEEKYHALFEGSANPINIVNRNGTILMINLAGAKTFGLSQQECIGKSVFNLIPSLDSSFHEVYQRVVDYGEEITSEVYVELPSGPRWFLALNQPVIGKNGKRSGVQVISYDITERKMVEQELENYSKNLERMVEQRTSELISANEKLEQEIIERKQAEKKLRNMYEKEKKLREQLESEINKRIEFTRALAHELKTPLTSVLISSQVLSTELKGGHQLSLAKNIRRGAINLNERINELLDVAKGEIGMLRLQVKPLNMRQLLEEVVDDVTALAETRGLSIVLELPQSLPIVWADAVRSKQIILNLLNNALKFTPAGGTIYIRARESDGSLLVEVQDTGPGIPKEEQDKIFDPYHRLLTDKEGHSGLGLGLSLCKSLVTLHGGNIWVKSDIGKGATFSFSLPLEAAKQSY